MLYFGKQEFAFSDALNLALDFECHLSLSERTTISTLRSSLKIKSCTKQNMFCRSDIVHDFSSLYNSQIDKDQKHPDVKYVAKNFSHSF